MERMTELDLPGLPERPLRPYEVTAELEHRDGPAVPVRCPSVVEALHTAGLSRWRLSMLSPCASVALQVAETLLPEAAGAAWTVRPAASG